MARVLSVTLGASQVTLAEFRTAGNALTLAAYGSQPFSIVEAEASDSVGAMLTPALQAIMREQGIKAGPAYVSLNGQSVFPKFAKLPPMLAPDKLAENVRFEVEQNVPFPIDEIIYDSQVLGETPEGDTACLIVSAKADKVRPVTDAVAAAGLAPVVVDVAPMAVTNALRALRPDVAGCSVILDIGARATNLVIAEDEKLYTRSIPVAGNTIDKELANSFGCSKEEAEAFKKERGYVALGGVTEDEDETADKASKVIRAVMSRLQAEISRSINFYRSQQGGSAPAQVFLTGGTARLPQLDEFFRQNLQVEVTYLNPFETVALGPKVSADAIATDAFTLAEATGLAFRATALAPIKINLMPQEIIAAAKAKARIPFVTFAGACVCAGLAFALVATQGVTEALSAKVEEVTAKNDGFRALEGKLKAAQSDVAAEAEKARAFATLLAGRSAEVRHVMAVRRSLVPGMWITEWSETERKPEVAEETNNRRPNRQAVAPKPVTVTRVVIRGWREKMAAVVAAAEGAATPGELVQNALKAKPGVVKDSVKIVAQKDVKDCLNEFAVELVFDDEPCRAEVTK